MITRPFNAGSYRGWKGYADFGSRILVYSCGSVFHFSEYKEETANIHESA
jgi:hypothetical protein